MREYIVSIGAVMTLASFSQMILPDGSIKKFVSLALGFMIILAVVSPGNIEFPEFRFEEGTFYYEENSEEMALYKAEVLKKHRENLKEIIEKKFKHGSKAFVEVDADGEIIGVTLNCKGDESSAVAFIVNELKLERERIKIVYEDN